MNQDVPTAIEPKVHKNRLSPIWILPFIALLIAAWLVYKSISEAGIMVEMTFRDAQGIELNKTRVIYRGLPIGVVRKLAIQPDFHSVVATIEFDRIAKSQLREDTQFWMVKAELSASGIRGLETIIKGNYIAMKPGNGEPQFKFKALDDQPLENADKIGLYLQLLSDDPGSIGRGNKVYYRHIEAGEVQDVYINKQDQVVIRIRIKPAFVKKVRVNSRFYQLSGVSFEGGIDGISLKTAPLAAMLSGGVSFVTPDLTASPVYMDHQFALYPSEKKAVKSTTQIIKPGLYLSLLSKNSGSIKEGQKIYYHQIDIGEVIDLGLTDDDQIKVDIFIEKAYQNRINKSSLFYQKSGISLEANLEGISLNTESFSSIISGGIVVITPDKKAPLLAQKSIRALYKDEASARGQTQFKRKDKIVTLHSENSAALKIGSILYYHGFEAGKVKNVRLLDNDKMEIKLSVSSAFFKRINKSTQFYLKDGLSFEGGIDGIKFSTGSLATLLKTGISFYTPNKNEKKIKPSHIFTLYAHKSDAELANQNQLPGLYLTLKTDDPNSVSMGSLIYLKHIPVGKVIKLDFDQNNQVEISIRIESKYRQKITNNSQFYQAGGITLKGGLRGFKIQTQSLASVVKGGIAVHIPNIKAAPAKNGQQFKLYADIEDAQKTGIEITLQAANADDLIVGNEIKYLGLTIGKITDITIKNRSTAVIFKANIEQKYQYLIRSHTLFWIVKPEVSLTGIKNISSIVSGTYLQILPGNGRLKRHFNILNKPPLAVNLQHRQNDVLEIVLESDRLGTIHVDAPVMYRDVKVGRVVSVGLADNATNVNIKIAIDSEYTKLVRTDSQFWRASGISLDAGIFTGVSLNFGGFESLIQGGISFATPGKNQVNEDDSITDEEDVFMDEEAPLFERVRNKIMPQPPESQAATQGMHFTLADDPDKDWLEWKAVILK